jgi:hypothetical protein
MRSTFSSLHVDVRQAVIIVQITLAILAGVVMPTIAAIWVRVTGRPQL